MALLNAHQRKVLTAIALGSWLFAFFVGVVHACGIDAESGLLQQTVSISADSQDQDDEDALPGCEQFCADDLPLLAKLQSVQDQPGGYVLPLPSSGAPILARVISASSPLHRRYPPPGIALITRFVRLAL